MRIKSKFQDYYDGIQAYGHDKTLCYVRKKEDGIPFPAAYEEQFRELIHSCPTWATDMYDQISGARNLEPFIVGFCGKFYLGARQNISTRAWSVAQHYAAFYDINDIEKFVKDIKSRDDRKAELKHLDSNRYSFLYDTQLTVRERFSKFFDTTIPDDDQIFFDLKTPMFVAQKYPQRRCDDRTFEIVINPCLKDYGFVKVYDPFTTFQEIDMYLGGVLGLNEPDMVNISDVHMRDKKGFNDMSFKKYPTKSR